MSVWTGIGDGVSGTVYALAHDGTNLYVAGDFKTAGFEPANYVAKWDGFNWTNLGSGLDGQVSALAYNGTSLYASGLFLTAGGVSANYVAKWGEPLLESSGVSPSSGSYTGNYEVVISGTNLCNGTLGDVTSVTLCGVVASVKSVSGSTQIVVTAGVSGVAGLGDVVVNSTGFGANVKSNAFTYNAPGLQVLGVNGAVISSGSAAIVATGAKFTPILPGATITNTFSITNNGTALMTISGAGIQGSGFSVAGIPATVAVGVLQSRSWNRTR